MRTSKQIAADFANIKSLELRAQDLRRKLYPLEARLEDAKRVWRVIDGKPVQRIEVDSDTVYTVMALGGRGREGVVRYHRFGGDYQVMMIEPGHPFRDKIVDNKEEAHRMAVEWVVSQTT